MVEIEKPRIECIEKPGDNSYGKCIVEPLERGYGTTLGNSLRRILLSSLPGTAVTSIKIAGVQHEFSSIPGVKEDVTEIVLNVKGIIAKLYSEGTKTVYIEASGEGVVTAGDIKADSEVEILQLEEDERVFARTCSSSFGKVPGTAKTLTFDDSDNKVQQAATIENFARAVRSETDIQCSLEEGLRSLQIIHGAYLSHWLERTVPLPPPEDLFRSHLAQLS